MHSLSNFVFSRVLNEDPILKTLAVLGTLPKESDSTETNDAIILIEKTHFATQSSENDITRRISELVSTGSNDIYFWWNAILSPGNVHDPDLKMSVIYPATEAHISKYSRQERKMVTETPEIYKNLVLPWIESQPKSRIQWVENILNGLKEKENVLFRDEDPDTGFIILPDSKWDRRTLSSLYLLVISRRGDVRSLRDLKKEHLPMLKNIHDKIATIVPQQFPGVAHDEVRMFVHYHPSYSKRQCASRWA
ncbi:hypothetical protein BGZ80_000554 [Entomortierella chlamydospora]|uniref:Uncharacterized protein n=1 Tax=Entomortierella chlamydospora TaxID=101097 RepID=A0A9P6MSH9_9FUNG|nr:hypothetical protein BGZ80_000554 [Entomortierella chlamydospora]